jgi:hypothetical protein
LVFFRFIGKAVYRQIPRDDADEMRRRHAKNELRGKCSAAVCGSAEKRWRGSGLAWEWAQACPVAPIRWRCWRLLKIGAELGVVASAAHFNHKLRGKTSDADGLVFAVAEKQNSRKTKPVIACSCGRLRSVLVESS